MTPLKLITSAPCGLFVSSTLVRCGPLQLRPSVVPCGQPEYTRVPCCLLTSASFDLAGLTAVFAVNPAR